MKAKGLHISILALLLAAAMLFSACESGGEAAPQMELSNSLPAPPANGSGGGGSFVASLYFLSDDGLRLSVEERELECGVNMSRVEAAVEALIDGPHSSVLNESVPGDVSLHRVETSSDACNVYLLASYTPDARTWITARAAIAATVYACEDIATVNLYLNGAEPGYYGRALGAMAPISNTLDSYIVELQQEYKEISEAGGTEAGIFETRIATLYFTDPSRTLLIAENTTLNYNGSETNDALAALLINKLLDGSDGLVEALPPDMELHSQPRLMSLESFMGDTGPEEGDAPHPNVIIPGGSIEEPGDVGIAQDEPMLIEVMIRDSEDMTDVYMMCGSITLTLTGYIPNIQGVVIGLVDEGGEVELLSERGYFTREDFASGIGRTVYIAYPSADGGAMYRVSRAVQSSDSYNPRRILEELFIGPADPGVMYPLFSQDDIQDVYITDNTVVVDWKAGFADKLDRLIREEGWEVPGDRRERMFIYSVVNTLSEIQGISRVWMLEDGRKLGKIDSIYLGNALMRNPGILTEE